MLCHRVELCPMDDRGTQKDFEWGGVCVCVMVRCKRSTNDNVKEGLEEEEAEVEGPALR